MSEITLTPRSRVQAKAKAYYDHYTRGPDGGTEEYWDRCLKEFDPHLSLRWSHLFHWYVIYYDYKGKLEAIRTFKPDESFFCAFKNIQHNSTLKAKDLQRFKQRQEEQEQRAMDAVIEEGTRETVSAYKSMLGEKVTTDGVKDNDY